MLKALADFRRSNSAAAHFRRQRLALLAGLMEGLSEPVRILDVGGTQLFWDTNAAAQNLEVEVTLLNVTAQPVTSPRFTSVAGDARSLDYDDNSFDVVFSNSVIEHVGDHADQQRMAEEVRRVGARYFVQTPNRWFPIEPHFLVPLFQFLPVRLRVWLVRHRALGWHERASSREEAHEMVTSIRLLGRRRFVSLFPDGTLHRERLLGLTKSFIIYGGWGPSATK